MGRKPAFTTRRRRRRACMVARMPGPAEPPRPGHTRRAWLLRGHFWALLVLLGSLLLVIGLWRVAYEREMRAANLMFINGTAEVTELLKQLTVQYELVAGGGASLFASVARPTPQHWHGYVGGMENRHRFPGFFGL